MEKIETQPLEASAGVSLILHRNPGACCPDTLFTVHSAPFGSAEFFGVPGWTGDKSNWTHLEQSRNLPSFWYGFENKPRWYPQQQRWYESVPAASPYEVSTQPTSEPPEPRHGDLHTAASKTGTFRARNQRGTHTGSPRLPATSHESGAEPPRITPITLLGNNT